MTGLAVHVGLFVVLSAAIVLFSCFYSEPDDGPALRSFPRRFGVFLASCAAIALVMLALERAFAWV